MKVKPIREREIWELFRAYKPETHSYSFSYRWLSFQADWLKARRVTLGLWDNDKLVDIFAGIKKGNTVFAGADMAPGGCVDPKNLFEFCDYLSDSKIHLNTPYKIRADSDTNFNLIIDLSHIENVEEYKTKKVARDARQRYNKANRVGFHVCAAGLDDFMECYEDMCIRNRVKSPLSRDFFRCMISNLKDEMMIKAFTREGRLMGSSMLLKTPGQMHAYFLLSKQEAFKQGLSSYLFFDMVFETLNSNKIAANCGPSSPWDGNFKFKRRLGAEPIPLYSCRINAGLFENTIFRFKKRIKEYKSERYFNHTEIQG